MKINTEISANHALLKVAGRFDMETNHIFRSAYRKLISDSQKKKLVVDMAEVDYLDSSALGMLLLLRQDAEANSVVVSLARCSDFVVKTLRTAHFDRLFSMTA